MSKIHYTIGLLLYYKKFTCIELLSDFLKELIDVLSSNTMLHRNLDPVSNWYNYFNKNAVNSTIERSVIPLCV